MVSHCKRICLEMESLSFISTGIYDSPCLLLYSTKHLHTIHKHFENKIYSCVVCVCVRQVYIYYRIICEPEVSFFSQCAGPYNNSYPVFLLLLFFFFYILLRSIFFLLQSCYAGIVWIHLCMGIVIDFSVDDHVNHSLPLAPSRSFLIFIHIYKWAVSHY